MRVLLSINPQYADKIFSGEKIYEYRRNIFKNTDVKIVLVYATSPIKKIIGEFYIEKIGKMRKYHLFKELKDFGINQAPQSFQYV